MSVHVERIGGKALSCRVGRHEIVTDRKADDGGADAGPTSGEVLLAAIGSCAAGSTRNALVAKSLPLDGFAVDVGFGPPAEPGGRDAILIRVTVPPAIADKDIALIEATARGGGVVSRLALGSTVHVSVARAAAGRPVPA